MRFIGAGLNKTGTKSLAHALRVLGYKVYDFDEQLLHYEDEFNGLYFSNQVPDFHRMFKDVDAVVDFPCHFFFEELMEAFPEAKVILTVRTDEEAWKESMKHQVQVVERSFVRRFKFFIPAYQRNYRLFQRNLAVVYGIFSTDSNSMYIALKRYRQHNDRVKSVVPADKLLVFSVEQGWKPLCEFTGKDIPDEPFPHLNIKGAVMNTFMKTEYGKRIQDDANFAINCFLLFIFIISVVLLSYVAKLIF